MPQISIFSDVRGKDVEGFDITRLLADFVLAMVILWMSNRQIETLKDSINERDDRIKRIEAKLDECHEEHRQDLRDWSGLEPRFKTWAVQADTDTKLRLTMQEREMLQERMKPSE